MRRVLPFLVALSACPAPTVPDAGPEDSGQMIVDSGPPPPTCDSPEDCKAVDFPGVCRQGVCKKNVPCSDDLECGLGEACVNHGCAFVGCTRDADCPTGRCRASSYSCVECGRHSDCPFDKPMCQMATEKCVQCIDDSSCPVPGAPYCETVSGTCKHCLLDQHCPNGLRCISNACVGVGVGGMCPQGTSCAQGLTCVNLNSGGQVVPTCLTSCNVYQPQCGQGEICYALKYSTGNAYVFDLGGLLGVCFQAGAGKNYRDSCDYSWLTGGNCKAQFMCIPDSSATASCRAFCDPGQANACPAPEVCHPFPGDFNGRQFGICFNDTGWGTKCDGDSKCRPGQSCQPWDDPSTDDFTANDVGTFCQYNAGPGTGLAPCGDTRLADGGIIRADRTCQSGTCRTDGTTGLPPYYCWAACQSDSDCSIGSRTGTCDSRFNFLKPGGMDTADLYGCRPGCQSHATCGEYADAGLACTLRLSTLSRNSGLKLECGRPVLSGAGPGAPCTAGAQCYSGMCSTDDARGVRRSGYCLEACQTAADCSPAGRDAGPASGPLGCQPTTYLGYLGQDFRAGTADDVLSVKRVCSGVTCNEDEDCSEDGGARCAPDVSPLDAGSIVLRCRPPAQVGFREAGAPCVANTECRSGACGRLADGGSGCFRACDPAGALCPAGTTCQAGAYRFTATHGNTVAIDGCAP